MIIRYRRLQLLHHEVLNNIQNYIFTLLKSNPNNTTLIKHIEILEKTKKENKLGIKPTNLFDDLCLKLIK